MRKSIDPSYITNTLSYIYLLPLNEQIEHFNIILQYFNMNSKRNCSNTRHYNLIKKAINLINKNMHV